MVLRMLENLSITWGGSGHLLVPIGDQGEVHDEIWKLVKLYDADRWAAYVDSYRAFQMADEQSFSDWLNREARRWARKHGGGVVRAREMLTADHIMHSAVGGWPPPPELGERLRRETGIWAEDGRVIFAMYQADSRPGHHVVDVTDLDPLPERVRVLDTQQLPESLQLLVGMRTGALAPSHAQRLVERGVSVETIEVDDRDIAALLRVAWLGKDRSGRWALHQALVERLGGVAKAEPPFVENDLLDSTPLALSRLGCSVFSRFHSGRDETPFTVVVGDHVDDFAYAMCLERCGVPALWFPKEFVSGRTRLAREVRETLAECLVDGSSHSLNEPHQLCSTSIGAPMLERFRDRLAATTWGSRLETVVVDRAELPPFRIPSVMDQDRYDDPMDVPFDGDEMASGCPVTTPSGLRADDPWKLTWWVEVGAPGHLLPARSALNSLVVAEPTGWRSTARTGSDGICFFSHTMGLTLSGTPLEHHLDRPRLRLASAVSVFEELGRSAGLTIEESSAGRFRRLTEELWGGIDHLAEDLRDDRRRQLLDAWLSRSRSGDDPGVFTTSNRRFLSLNDASFVSGLTEAEVRPILDQYLERSILRRGLALQCQHCRLFEWYELEALGQAFECRRCQHQTKVTKGAWKGDTNEPAFYYDLVEVAYQALRGNAHVPIAALDAMRRYARSFLHVPEIETTDQNSVRLELDIAAIVDGRIVLGEAKSGDKLGDTKKKENDWLEKFARVADLLGADEVVFATSRPRWRDVTRERIRTTFEGRTVDVTILEAV